MRYTPCNLHLAALLMWYGKTPFLHLMTGRMKGILRILRARWMHRRTTIFPLKSYTNSITWTLRNGKGGVSLKSILKHFESHFINGFFIVCPVFLKRH